MRCQIAVCVVVPVLVVAAFLLLFLCVAVVVFLYSSCSVRTVLSPLLDAVCRTSADSTAAVSESCCRSHNTGYGGVDWQQRRTLLLLLLLLSPLQCASDGSVRERLLLLLLLLEQLTRLRF